MDYKDKLISLQQALDLVQDGDYIVLGMAASDPIEFSSHLHEIAPRITEVTVSNCLPMCRAEYIVNPELRSKFNVESWFYNGDLRKNAPLGNISFIPNHLHFANSKRLAYRKPDVFVANASMPDKHGYVSLLGNTYEIDHIRAAKTVILEINPNIPRVFGDSSINISEVDYLVECNYPAPEIPEGAIGEKDAIIGGLISQYIHDGDCIQIGIGGIPDAVVASLYDKKNLGVHTEMMTTGLMKLAKAGAITCANKQTKKHRICATFIAGTRELYDFVDDNPFVEVHEGGYTNDPFVIAQNDNQVSINTTPEVDLTGQCASESIGSKQFSGAGGQADTAVGAKLSKGGRSFIALYSTAMVKNPDGRERRKEQDCCSTCAWCSCHSSTSRP